MFVRNAVAFSCRIDPFSKYVFQSNVTAPMSGVVVYFRGGGSSCRVLLRIITEKLCLNTIIAMFIDLPVFVCLLLWFVCVCLRIIAEESALCLFICSLLVDMFVVVSSVCG